MISLKKFFALSVSILLLCVLTACADGSSDGRAMNDATAGRGILENAADDVKDTADKVMDDVKDSVDHVEDDVENAAENAGNDMKKTADDLSGNDGTEEQMK